MLQEKRKALEQLVKRQQDLLAKEGGLDADGLAEVRKLTGEIQTLSAEVKALQEAHASVAEATQFNSAPLPGVAGSLVEGVGYRADVGQTTIERDERTGETHTFHSGAGVLSDAQVRAISTPEYRQAFEVYLRTNGNVTAMPDVHRRALEAGNDAQGGALIPPDYLARLIQRKPAPTRLAGRVTQLTTSRDELTMPKQTGGDDTIYPNNIRVGWTGEGGNAADAMSDEKTFSNVKVPIHEGIMVQDVQRTLIEDSGFDIVSWVVGGFSQAYSLEVERCIAGGNGIAQPRGFSAQLSTIEGITTGVISAKDILKLPFQVAEQYIDSACWVMNRKSSGAAVAQILDGNDRPLFAPGVTNDGLSERRPDMLQGFPICYSAFMADVAAGEIPVAFGDLKGYYLVQRMAASIQFLDQTKAVSGKVQILFRYRVGGDFLEPWTMKGLLIKS